MKNRRLWIMASLVALVAASMGHAQTVSVLPDEVRAATTELSAAQKQQVDQFLIGHAQQIAESSDSSVIRRSGDAVMSAYTSATGGVFRLYMAESAARNFAPVALAGKSPVSQVNAALAIAAIREPGILPAMKLMLEHSNAAVRYYGAKLLTELRPALLSLGGEPRQSMFAMLNSRCRSETSGPVLKALYKAADLTSGGNLANLDVMTLASAQNEARRGVVPAVQNHLGAIRSQNVGLIEAHVEAVKTLEALAAAATDADRAAIVQTLADLMANAGEAYLDAIEARRDTPALPDLLRSIETALSRITSNQELPVTRALETSTAERGASVKLAVNRWVGTATTSGILNAAPYNVKPPEVSAAGR